MASVLRIKETKKQAKKPILMNRPFKKRALF